MEVICYVCTHVHPEGTCEAVVMDADMPTIAQLIDKWKADEPWVGAPASPRPCACATWRPTPEDEVPFR